MKAMVYISKKPFPHAKKEIPIGKEKGKRFKYQVQE